VLIWVQLEEEEEEEEKEEKEEVEWILSKIGRIKSGVRTKSRNSSGGRASSPIWK
jgi:hypothetical protein